MHLGTLPCMHAFFFASIHQSVHPHIRKGDNGKSGTANHRSISIDARVRPYAFVHGCKVVSHRHFHIAIDDLLHWNLLNSFDNLLYWHFDRNLFDDNLFDRHRWETVIMSVKVAETERQGQGTIANTHTHAHRQRLVDQTNNNNPIPY